VQTLITLPEDVRARLDLHLYSELEGRVPHGEYQKFFVARILEFLDHERLDLAPFLIGCQPGTTIISGPADAIMALKRIISV
jgi:hypothetical protein